MGWLWASISADVNTCNKLKQVTKATRPTTIQMVTFDAGYSGAISITSPGVSDHQDVRRVRSWELAGCYLELGADVLVHGHIRLHLPNLGTERIAIEPRQQFPGYRCACPFFQPLKQNVHELICPFRIPRNIRRPTGWLVQPVPRPTFRVIENNFRTVLSRY